VTQFDGASVRSALEAVRSRIVAAGGGADVSILPVTKGFGPEAIEAAIEAGANAIGENYAQELVAKAQSAIGIDVHFIGQLQTNKVRLIADLVDLYETLDRAKLAREIAKRAPGAAVLAQVDTAGESGKGGCPFDGVDELVDVARELGLDVRGLMTVGPTEGGPEAARPGFRRVRQAVDRLGLAICSMGMSGDLEVAVQEGSTQVRVGTALFGPRPVHTWRDQER
jgi:pyridoxal phosphate enzyme (YggS family)